MENEAQRSTDEETTWLRSDLKTADVVAYVNIKELAFADRTDEETDCENNTRGGYCSYLLKAEIKELFKGRMETKTLEFYVGAEATYPKKGLLGERIVFLVWDENEKDNTRHLVTIENSTRPVDALAAMRKVVNPRAPIDENNESEPYSLKSLKKDFEETDIIVYADVTGFMPDRNDESGSHSFMLKAEVKEVFKGTLKSGEKFEYKTDFLYRPVRSEDLGEQVVFLERQKQGGKVIYKRINHTISDIQYDVLEKLRRIAKERSNGKN